MVAESWFRNLLKPRKHDGGYEKVEIGVLAFEVASLMSKLVYLWQALSDKQILRLRVEITNSVGIKKMVSEDDEYIVSLICGEMFENMIHVAKSVARIAKRCHDPGLKNFESAFDDLILFGVDPYGWEFSSKKMEKKVKKMEHFISANASLYQEMELLADLEQTFRRMKNSETEPENLLEFHKKVMWKQHEVKSLREISLWRRTYDYTVRLLAKSLFTIFGRIKHVFGIEHSVDGGDSSLKDSDFIHRSQSVSTLLQSSVHPAEETSIPRFSSGSLATFTMSGPLTKTRRTNYFHSGPLGGSTAKSGSVAGKSGKYNNFHSGPLGKPVPKSGPFTGMNKFSRKFWPTPNRAANSSAKKPPLKTNRLAQMGPLKGCTIAADGSSIVDCHISSNGVHGALNGTKDGNLEFHRSNAVQINLSVFKSQRRFLVAPPETLGAVALSLHYANVIIVIEKLAASPHLIGHDARDDLYNMLPASVRGALRSRLKPYTKSLASSVYDTVLAGEWTEAMASILEWLAPLAHNMIRWQSERSFEQQNLVSTTNVLLVQTLYFANQEKTEAAITELLVGLNYVWRFGRELNAKALQECASGRTFEEFLELEK